MSVADPVFGFEWCLTRTRCEEGEVRLLSEMNPDVFGGLEPLN